MLKMKILLIFISAVAFLTFTITLIKIAKPQEISQQNLDQRNPQSSNQQDEQKLPIETVAADLDTANWKTYQSEKYGFEFRYPEDWYIIEENDSYTGEKFYRVSNYQGPSFGKGDTPGNFAAFNITVFNNKTDRIAKFIEIKNSFSSTPKTEISYDVGSGHKEALRRI